MTSIFPTEPQHAFFLDGPAGRLETITTFPRELQSKTVAILCHPHPLQLGTMQNKVVTILAKAYDLAGIPTLRFNFRGVGKSEGSFANAVGEVDDAMMVAKWAQEALSDFTIAMAGFSFGAYIAARTASKLPKTRHLITISPAVDRYDFKNCGNVSCPWLLVMGEKDEVVDPETVWTFAKNPPAPVELIKMPGVGHFYHGQLLELRKMVLDWIVSH